MNTIKKHQLQVLAAELIVVLLVGALAPSVAQTRKKTPTYYSVSANHVLRVRLNNELNSEKATVGEVFTSTLVDPLYSKNGVLLAPQGTTVVGHVTNVQRAQKKGKPAVLDVRFTSLKLPNGVRRAFHGSLTDLDTSTGSSDNEGSVTAHKTSHRNAKFIGGGAAGGALIGGIAGGGKGLAIGAGVGALTGAITGRVKKGHEVKVKSGTEFGVIVNQVFSLPAYKAG